MKTVTKFSHHLCYNNIIILKVCQLKKEKCKIKEIMIKMKKEIHFFQKQSKGKQNRLISFICFFNFLKIKQPEKAESRKENMITKEFEKERTQAKKEIKNENPFRIFENEKFGELEIFMEEGIIWIEASKSAEILGYKNPHKAIKDHCINEYPYLTIHSVGIKTGKKRNNNTAIKFVEKMTNFISPL